MRQDETPQPPREPEIEFLARVVRVALAGLRVVFWIAGVVGIAVGALSIAGPGPPILHGMGMVVVGHAPNPIAQHVVWLCPGLLLVLPVEWLFGRGRWWLLAVSALLWFVPIWLPGDHRWGFLLRIFASVVALSSLLVWRTLWRLTKKAPASD